MSIVEKSQRWSYVNDQTLFISSELAQGGVGSLTLKDRDSGNKVEIDFFQAGAGISKDLLVKMKTWTGELLKSAAVKTITTEKCPTTNFGVVLSCPLAPDGEPVSMFSPTIHVIQYGISAGVAALQVTFYIFPRIVVPIIGGPLAASAIAIGFAGGVDLPGANILGGVGVVSSVSIV